MTTEHPWVQLCELLNCPPDVPEVAHLHASPAWRRELTVDWAFRRLKAKGQPRSRVEVRRAYDDWVVARAEDEVQR